jgi:glycosyltransferase involved in cell wall biosynthesis
MAHALEKVIDAAEKLQDRDDIGFLFVGNGAAKEELDREIAEKELHNVRSLPRQPKERIPQLSYLTDVAVVPLRDSPVFESVIPSKIFECMATATPMILSIPEGEATRLAEHWECGVAVQPENPDELAEMIRSLADNPDRRRKMGDAARNAATSFSRPQQAKRMRQSLALACGITENMDMHPCQD